MSHDLSDDEPSTSVQADTRAFGIAHGIFAALKRVFYSWLPVLLLMRWADWSFWPAIVGGLAAGYGLEAIWKWLLKEGDDE
jgi:hypothetical protein